jgi:hypothetical protein
VLRALAASKKEVYQVAEENKLLYAGQQSSRQHLKIPIGSEEDVEFADELADEDDQEAQQRAAASDQRVVESEGE